VTDDVASTDRQDESRAIRQQGLKEFSAQISLLFSSGPRLAVLGRFLHLKLIKNILNLVVAA
jgi:hypothetical protein